MTYIRPPFYRQVSIIPSSEPENDALTFTRLFTCFTRDVRDQSPRSVTLIGCSKNEETTVIFCKCNGVSSIPSLLLLGHDNECLSLSTIEEIIQNPSSGVQALPFNGSSDESFMLQFLGGGTLLVVLSQNAESSMVTELIVAAVASLERITTLDSQEEEQKSQGSVPKSLVHSSSNAASSLLLKNSPEEVLQMPQIIKTNGKSIMMEETPIKIPTFHTLQVTLDGNPFPLNTPEPFPFENDLFSGKILLLLRPIDPVKEDPYWNERIWARRRRRFLLQIQGKFKRLPRGTVYAGAEVSESMKLGLLAKGVCNLLLKFLSTFARDLHYSFGDANENGHISAPAWNMFQNIVQTKPGETPPPLGDDIEESKESIAARGLSDASGAQWNTTDIFTMSYHSMYIDLPTWQVVQLPFAPSLDLRTFWGKSLLTICIYDTPELRCRRHFRRDNGYYVAIQLKFLGLDTKTKDDDQEPMPWSFNARSISEGNLDAFDVSGSSDGGAIEPTIEELDGEEYYFFDAEEMESASVVQPTVRKPAEQGKARRLLSDVDSVCPMWIDMSVKGKYVTLYAINLKGKTIFRYASSVSECFDVLQDQELAESLWSPRLSQWEKTRRVVGQVISSSISKSTHSPRLEKLIRMETAFDSCFLRGTPPTLLTKKASLVQKSAFVARAVSDRHWVEEWMKVTHKQIAFYHPDKMQKASLYLSLNNLLSVRKLPTYEVPSLASYYSFMELRTLGQAFYLMFASENVCDSWVAYLSTVINIEPIQEWASDHSGTSDHLISVDNPTKEFLHKSSMWNCKQRRVLNCRMFSFHSCRSLDALPQVEDALMKALEPREDSEDSNLCAFLDSAAALKQVDVSNLTEAERTVFFLNLYHVMIVHAFLVLGPPDSTFKWISYFNTIAYQCSDDIFSLTELEHNIIRAAMCYPSQFVSRFVLPKSQFSFALTKADYRINFALNCGSLSNPDCIPVYKAATLDKQLDAASETYLKVVDVVAQKRNSLTVNLPRVCVWFAEDFGDGSNNAIIQCVEKHLAKPQRKLLASCWDGTNARYVDVSIRHLPFSFTCRTLRRCSKDFNKLE